MEPIYDRTGHPVGWLLDDVVRDMKARPRAFVDRGAVYSYDARYLGVVDRGFFRDRDGRAVAFVRGASAGPVMPPTKSAPMPPIPPIAPVHPMPPVPPPPPTASAKWSELEWDRFING